MAYRQTKNPRIAFVPTDAVEQVIHHMARVSGKSRAAVVAELMTDLVPFISQQAESYESILNRAEQAREFVQALTEESQRLAAQPELPLDKPKRQRKRKGATSGPT